MLLVAVTVLTSKAPMHTAVIINRIVLLRCVLCWQNSYGGEERSKIQPPTSGPHTLKSSVELLSKKRTPNIIHVTVLESPLNDFVSTITFFLSTERHWLWLHEVSQGFSKHVHSNVRFDWTVYSNAYNQHCLLVTKHRCAQTAIFLSLRLK